MEKTATTYPKRYMSINELVSYGFTRCELKSYLKIMKKIEPDNWFYKYYATIIWALYSAFVFLS